MKNYKHMTYGNRSVGVADKIKIFVNASIVTAGSGANTWKRYKGTRTYKF